MTKKAYMKPTMRTVELRHRTKILVGSVDANGMNKQLQNEEVDEGYQAERGAEVPVTLRPQN